MTISCNRMGGGTEVCSGSQIDILDAENLCFDLFDCVWRIVGIQKSAPPFFLEGRHSSKGEEVVSVGEAN